MKYKLALDREKMCANILKDHLVELTEREWVRSSVVSGRIDVVQMRYL